MADDYMGYKRPSGHPDTAPHTPLEQAPPPFMLHGVGSSTSICTTDDEDSESQFPWTDEQEQYVRQVLQEYQDNPRNTPFSGRFPPSGVVQQVARRVLRRAPRNTFPHSLIAIRKRILLICAREMPEDLDLPPSAYPEQSHSYSMPQQTFGAPLQPGPLLGAPLPARAASEYEEFDFGQPTQPVVLASPFKEDQRFPRALQTQAQPSSASTSQLDSNVLNIVAQRKRDSLKIKRGLK